MIYEVIRRLWTSKAETSERRLRHVNSYLTPLAVLIVVPGLFVSPQPRAVILLAAILMVYSVSANYLSLLLLKRNPKLVRSFRVGSNYAVNIFLLWMLYSAWPVVWVLLLLMSLGVAVYLNRRDSLISAAAFALMLAVVHWEFGRNSLQDWAIVGVEASMIILFNLFVNGLAQIASEPGQAEGDGAHEPENT